MDREDTDCKLDCRQKDVKTLWNCPLLVSQLALPPDRQARPRQSPVRAEMVLGAALSVTRMVGLRRLVLPAAISPCCPRGFA